MAGSRQAVSIMIFQREGHGFERCRRRLISPLGNSVGRDSFHETDVPCRFINKESKRIKDKEILKSKLQLTIWHPLIALSYCIHTLVTVTRTS